MCTGTLLHWRGMIISLKLMEVDTRSSCQKEKQPLTSSISRNDGKMPEEGGEKGGNSPVFVNHGNISRGTL